MQTHRHVTLSNVSVRFLMYLDWMDVDAARSKLADEIPQLNAVIKAAGLSTEPEIEVPEYFELSQLEIGPPLDGTTDDMPTMELVGPDGEKTSLAEVFARFSDETTDPSRPFTGQPHTDRGERGKTQVTGIRFRDLADCVVRAWIDAAAHTIKDATLADELRRRADDGTLNWNDLYKLNCGDVDPIALVQNVTCRVEKAMGIYPNVPKLERSDDVQDENI